ncbi:CHRD domain-containing protein [Burkholderia gladioli]|nr:CHRD domain-containing protein [Burkholderia gladioli]
MQSIASRFSAQVTEQIAAKSIPALGAVLGATVNTLFIDHFQQAAHAETAKLTANLQPSSEVPPTATKGSGKLDASFDTATHTLVWTVSYSGLTGPATAAHFHGPAPVGQNAGVQVPIAKDALASPIKGSAVLNDQQVTELMAGKWYFNVHTKEHPSGEIRGQVEPAS